MQYWKEMLDSDVARSEVAPEAGMPGARKLKTYSPFSAPQPNAESGLDVSPVHLHEHVNN